MGAREEILQAADSLFGELGFDAASTREIAQRSGVNKALIHYHFGSKEALFEHVLDRYYERLNQVLSKALEGQGTVRQRITTLVDAYIDFLSQNRNFSKIVQRESSGGRHIERIRAHLLPMFQNGVELIQASFPAARSGHLTAHHLLVSLYGMIVSYFTYSPVLEHLMGQDPLSRRNLGERKKHIHTMINLILDRIEAQDRGS